MRDLLWILALILMSSCAHSNLDRFLRQSETGKTSNPKPSKKVMRQALYQREDPHAFIVSANQKIVWDGLLEVLLRNYPLQWTDENTSVATTDWDTTAQGSTLVRNRISFRTKGLGWNKTRVTILNAQQQYQVSDRQWVPITDSGAEVDRIFKNLAAWIEPEAPREGGEADESNMLPTVPAQPMPPPQKKALSPKPDSVNHSEAIDDALMPP